MGKYKVKAVAGTASGNHKRSTMDTALQLSEDDVGSSTDREIASNDNNTQEDKRVRDAEKTAKRKAAEARDAAKKLAKQEADAEKKAKKIQLKLQKKEQKANEEAQKLYFKRLNNPSFNLLKKMIKDPDTSADQISSFLQRLSPSQRKKCCGKPEKKNIFLQAVAHGDVSKFIALVTTIEHTFAYPCCFQGRTHREDKCILHLLLQPQSICAEDRLVMMTELKAHVLKDEIYILANEKTQYGPPIQAAKFYRGQIQTPTYEAICRLLESPISALGGATHLHSSGIVSSVAFTGGVGPSTSREEEIVLATVVAPQIGADTESDPVSARTSTTPTQPETVISSEDPSTTETENIADQVVMDSESSVDNINNEIASHELLEGTPLTTVRDSDSDNQQIHALEQELENLKSSLAALRAENEAIDAEIVRREAVLYPDRHRGNFILLSRLNGAIETTTATKTIEQIGLLGSRASVASAASVLGTGDDDNATRRRPSMSESDSS